MPSASGKRRAANVLEWLRGTERERVMWIYARVVDNSARAALVYSRTDEARARRAFFRRWLPWVRPVKQQSPARTTKKRNILCVRRTTVVHFGPSLYAIFFFLCVCAILCVCVRVCVSRNSGCRLCVCRVRDAAHLARAPCAAPVFGASSVCRLLQATLNYSQGRSRCCELAFPKV